MAQEQLFGFNMNEPIVPYYENSINSTHVDIYGKGGYRAVNTLDEMYAIPYARRSVGMEVRVLENQTVYYLKSFGGNKLTGVVLPGEQEWELVTTPSSGDNEGGEKEVYTGKLENGIFWIIDNKTGSLIPAETKEEYIYIDTETGITYRYNDLRKSFDRLNPMSWIEIE